MADRNKKRKNYFKSKDNGKKGKFDFKLEPGIKGFICTCNFRERDTVREAYNLLNEYADQLFGEEKLEPKQSSDAAEKSVPNKKIVFKDSDEEDGNEEKHAESEEDEEDVQSALAREVNLLKEERSKAPSSRRFQIVESGASNCLFIRTTVEDPVALAETIMKDIDATQKQKTRFLMRLIPIEATCKAWPEDIKEASEKLLDKYFKGDPKTFCVVFNRRNNNNVQREDVIQEIAADVKKRNSLHSAEMKQPDLAIVVEIIRNMCCMSVVPKYFYYRKCNLIELAKPRTAAATTSGDQTKNDLSSDNQKETNPEADNSSAAEEKSDSVICGVADETNGSVAKAEDKAVKEAVENTDTLAPKEEVPENNSAAS